MQITVRMTGIDTLTLKTKALITAARQGMVFGVQEAAALVVTDAQALCPVETGRLRDSIHSEDESDNTDDRYVQIVSPVYEADNKYGFEPPYARRIEYGFVGADSLGRHYHQAAQPYMRPAVDAQSAAAVNAIKDSIIGELDAVMADR